MNEYSSIHHIKIYYVFDYIIKPYTTVSCHIVVNRLNPRPTRLIKKCSDSLSPTITIHERHHHMMSIRHFPTTWKTANIKPLIKKLSWTKVCLQTTTQFQTYQFCRRSWNVWSTNRLRSICQRQIYFHNFNQHTDFVTQ